eukprot:755037-Hanusia_phi.AAC.3
MEPPMTDIPTATTPREWPAFTSWLSCSDFFHSENQPWRQSWTNIDTRYGGGSGTSGFSGGETAIADGYSPASYGVPMSYYNWY